MVYYVEDPSSNQYRLLNYEEIMDGNQLFGGNPEAEVAQSLIRGIFIAESDQNFQETIVQALSGSDHPSALFIYFDSEPIDSETASDNWVDRIDNGHFTACVTRENDDDYTSIVHYGTNQMNSDGAVAAQNRLVQLLTGINAGSSNENRIILNDVGFQAPVPNFLNWNNDRVHHIDSLIGGRREDFRISNEITQIVIHETAGFRFDNPSNPPDTWNKSGRDRAESLGAHFVVHTDGSITQHYDIAQRISHAGPRNDSSIGIEVVNSVWFDGRSGYRVPGTSVNNSERTLVHSWVNRLENKREYNRRVHGAQDDNSDRFESGTPRLRKHQRYVVPTDPQLMALNTLVDWLVNQPSLAIISDFLSLNHETVSGAQISADSENLFLLDGWRSQYGLDTTGHNRPGILSHFNIGGRHSDGTFPTFYLWLRSRNNSHAQAMTKIIGAFNTQIDGNNGRVNNRTRRQKFIDITGI
ncbi:hypothetical protein GCM10022397_12160 [Flavivirga jejuensis]